MWTGWPLARILMLFAGLGLLIIFIQVTLLHYRQNFRHWAMWGPVIGAPLIGVLALALALFNLPWLQTGVAVLFVIGIITGVGGFVLHVEGVGQRVDGYRMHNFMVGPPVTLPLMVAAMSVLGLFALYWRW